MEVFRGLFVVLTARKEEMSGLPARDRAAERACLVPPLCSAPRAAAGARGGGGPCVSTPTTMSWTTASAASRRS